MDDSCAVCADALEWVAYGPCGHREVCSTCVSRLRFICNDRRCCICKTESNVIFVTKALGDYTRIINDFSLLRTEVKEGRTGSYWYHEDTQAFFDDVDHYKMIKAMCKLSCSECDKIDEQQTDGSKRRGRFRNIEQLKGHLFHKHKLFMCSLCLEGRKVFICEQKLYTRAQLNQHISTGDSDVDGSESDRGGFSGHPMCEFCRNPFYGDNELYTHMSTEHYTCHICQRQNPGQYEYYKNYDDLEIHFRQSHFLCEDDYCLAKKFIVFQSEAEMKRHNAIEHGGRMSRAKRNAVLQIPTSFRYRRDTGQDHRRRRGRTFHRDFAEGQLSMAIDASLETANGNNPQSNLSSSSSSGQVAPDIGDATDSDPIIQPFESLTMTDSESTSRYLQALGPNSRNGRLVESSFPPLSTSTVGSQVKQQESLPSNTLAAHLRRQRKVSVLNSGQAWPAASREPALPPSNTSQAWPAASREPALPPSNTSQAWPAASREPALPPSNTSQAWPAASREPALPPSNTSQAWPAASREPALPPINTSQAWPAASREPALPPSNTSQAWPTMDAALGTSHGFSQNKMVIGNSRPGSSSYIQVTQVHPTAVHGPPSSGFLRDTRNYNQITHSASAPNLVDNGSFKPSASDFPPVSAAQVRKLPSTSQALQNTDDVQTANKSLVEKIRTALEFDQDKFSAFKEISGEYRQGLLDSETYLDYVQQFGLLHLVLDLAKLCPDVQKQTDLIKSYEVRSLSDSKPCNNQILVSSQMKAKNDSNKGKAKCLDVEDSNLKDTIADDFLGTVLKFQSAYNPPEEEVEVLSKHGYRSAKGKSKLIIDGQPQMDLNYHSDSSIKTASKKNVSSAGIDYGQKTGEVGGGSKQQKKTSKFHRVRLGDGSAASLSNLTNSNPHPDATSMDEQKEGNTNSAAGLPVRGVWRKGGHKLFS